MNIFYLARDGKTAELLALLNKGASIDAVDKVGRTPLHWACWHGHTEIAIALLERSANINAVNEVGQTPLHYACYAGHAETAIALLERGANIDAAGKDGQFPFDKANKEALTAIYLYYCSKSENDKANWLQEKYGLQMKDLL